jgi:hypothetical protein
VDNQHKKIIGYRDLSPADIDLMNEIKAHAEATRALVHKVRKIESEKFAARIAGMDGADAAATAAAAGEESQEAGRWISVAKTNLQQGYMALTRAVAKPATF